MARKSRKQKKRRTRRKRGGATDAETQACNKRCEEQGLPSMKAKMKCLNTNAKACKNRESVVPITAAVEAKPAVEKVPEAIPCKDNDAATYGKDKKGNCKKLREKQAFIDNVCKNQAGQHCIKTCGTCNKKICQLQSMSGGRRTRRRRGGNCTGVSKSIIKKFPNPIPCSTPRLLPPMRINVPLDYENITPRQQKTKETKESVKELPGAVAQGAAGGKRRRRRRKSRRKSRKRKSKRKSRRKRR
jgi:hypothetical protein